MFHLHQFFWLKDESWKEMFVGKKPTCNLNVSFLFYFAKAGIFAGNHAVIKLQKTA